MPSEEKQRLLDIIDRLPPGRVIQLIEFAERLQSEEKKPAESSAEAINEIFGKYRDSLTPSDEYSGMKADERALEDR